MNHCITAASGVAACNTGLCPFAPLIKHAPSQDSRSLQAALPQEYLFANNSFQKCLRTDDPSHIAADSLKRVEDLKGCSQVWRKVLKRLQADTEEKPDPDANA